MKLLKVVAIITSAVFCLFAIVDPASAQGLAFTTNICSVGGQPVCVTSADVNGDGKVDLITANYIPNNPGTLTVLTNNGNGIFGSNATLNVGNFPGAVIAADINGDGKPDLISANGNDSTLTVLTNNGTGVFGSNATLAVTGGPRYVIAADINGDGKLDLISVNSGNSTLTVLTNNGTGVFGSNATLNVGNHPITGVAADINGDGKVDLITANSDLGGPGTLTVLTNNGFGVFGSNATLNVGSHPVFVAAADINGDGKLELISVNQRDNTLTVLTNNGYGVFGSNATLNVGSNPSWVTAADINGDGKLDLICANSNTNTLTVLTNNGIGVFGANAALNVGNGSDCVIAADVNNDGHLDLISASPIYSTLTVLTQTIVGPPILSMMSTGPTNFLLSWSSYSTGFTVQTNADLTTTNWVPAGYPISIINGTNQSANIALPPTANLFFRLQAN